MDNILETYLYFLNEKYNYNQEDLASTYHITGAILGCLKKSSETSNLLKKFEIVERFKGDPWEATIRSKETLSKDELLKFHSLYTVDPDGNNLPFYYVVKDMKTKQQFVKYSDSNKNFTYKEAYDYGLKKGLPKEQLDFNNSNNDFYEYDKKNDLPLVNKIIRSFSDQEKKWMGPRDFYRPSEYRKVEIINGNPVAYVEARIYHGKAKINIGVHKEYRRKGYLKKVMTESIQEFKKLGVKKVLATANVRNIASNTFLRKFGFQEITDTDKLEKLNLRGSGQFFYELDI